MAELVDPLGVFGMATDSARLAGTEDRLISPAGAAVRVLVVTAREDLEIARQTTHVLAAMPAAR
jgi:acetate kinase